MKYFSLIPNNKRESQILQYNVDKTVKKDDNKCNIILQKDIKKIWRRKIKLLYPPPPSTFLKNIYPCHFLKKPGNDRLLLPKLGADLVQM